MEWFQQQVTKNDKAPSIDQATDFFTETLKRHYIPYSELDNLIDRGVAAIKAYLGVKADSFKPTDKAEVNFRGEGVLIGKARLAGNIDRMEIDKASKTITVVDFKTGAAYSKWKSDLKLLKYRQQLYFYKLLIEGSHSFQGYRVEAGRLDFIEPDQDGVIQSLEIVFDDKELAELKQLIQAVWQRIIELDLPDTSSYGTSLTGIKQFMASLQ